MKRIIIPLVIIALGVATLGTYSLSTLTQKPVTQAQTAPQSKYDVGPPNAQELLELVNAERAKVGVAPLVIDERLNKSAQMKADEMFNSQSTTHTDSNGEYNGLIAIRDSGIGCSEYGENIRNNNENVNTSREAVLAWVASPSHYKAMTTGTHKFTGFGVKHDQVVQHFCRI